MRYRDDGFALDARGDATRLRDVDRARTRDASRRCVDEALASAELRRRAHRPRVPDGWQRAACPRCARSSSDRFGGDKLRGGEELTSVASGLALRGGVELSRRERPSAVASAAPRGTLAALIPRGPARVPPMLRSSLAARAPRPRCTSCRVFPLPHPQLALSPKCFYDAAGADDELRVDRVVEPGDTPVDLATWSLGWGGTSLVSGAVDALGRRRGRRLLRGRWPESSRDNASRRSPSISRSISNPISRTAARRPTASRSSIVPVDEVTAETLPLDVVLYGESNDCGLLDRRARCPARGRRRCAGGSEHRARPRRRLARAARADARRPAAARAGAASGLDGSSGGGDCVRAASRPSARRAAGGWRSRRERLDW